MAGMLRVQVEPQALEVAPGASGTVRARAVNGTDTVEEYTVDVVGADPGWVRADPPRVSLLPGDEGTVDVTLALPREHPPEAGTRVVGVRFRPASDPRAGRVEEVTLTVSAAPAGALVVEPQQVRGGGSGRFTARVTNRGNTPLDIALSGEDPERAVTVTVTPPTLELRPGEQRQARVQVTAPRAWTGPEVLRPLVIRGRGGPSELSASVTFAQRSRMASGLLRGGVALAVAVLIGGSILAASWLVGGDTRLLGQATAGSPSPDVSESVGAPATAPSVAAALPAPAPAPGAAGPGPGEPPGAPPGTAPQQPPADQPTTGGTTDPPTPPTDDPVNPFLGSWRNENPATRSITRIEIVDGGNPDQPFVHAWGSCTPTDCDWGEQQGEIVGDGLVLQWDQGFVTRDMTITESGPGRLLVSTHSVYTDDRPPRLIEEAFVPA